MSRVLFFRRGIALALLAALTLFALPALAGNADKMTGTWVVDVERSLDQMEKSGGLGSLDRDEMAEEMASMKITYDIPGKTFTGERMGDVDVLRIDTVTENPDGSIHIVGEQLDDNFRFEGDDTLVVMEVNIVWL